MKELARYDRVECLVTGHRHFGLLVQTDGGRPGFVDRAEIADGLAAPADWPLVGSRLLCVVLGFARDGRVRVTSAPAYVELVGALDDPRQALREWVELKKSEGDAETVAQFYQSRHARALLIWGLKNPPGSLSLKLALSLVAGAPEALRKDLSPPDPG